MSWPEAVTRLVFVLMTTGPVLATVVVYGLRRGRITRRARFFLASIASGYALSLLLPLTIVVVGVFLGAVAEIATLYAIALSIPGLFVLHPLVAWFWSVRLADPAADGTAALPV